MGFSSPNLYSNSFSSLMFLLKQLPPHWLAAQYLDHIIVTQLFCNTFSLTITIFDAITTATSKHQKKPRAPRAPPTAVATCVQSHQQQETLLPPRQPCYPLTSTQLGVLNEKRHPSAAIQRGWGFHFSPEQNSNTERVFLSFPMPSTCEHNCPDTRGTSHHPTTQWGKKLDLLSTTQNQL